MGTLRRVPFFDARRAHASMRESLHAAAARVIDSGHYILGPEVDHFERLLRDTVDWGTGRDRGDVVGVSCGTDALILALKACDIGPGMEVIVPAFTFISPASAVLWVGATPIFADVEPGHLTLDPERVRALITPRTRAIIPVHLFGHPADMVALKAIAEEHDLHIIEDIAQALGAWIDGASVGAHGSAAALSFFPTKNLGGFGDGGAVFAHDLERCRRLRGLRVHGCQTRGQHDELGLNARLDALQAALLSVQIEHLQEHIDGRRWRASRYTQGLEGAAWSGALELPPGGRENGYSTFNQFVVRVNRRDAVRERLARDGIETQIYYRNPVPSQPVFAEIAQPAGQWPTAEQACKQVIALPIGPGMTHDDVDYVVEKLNAAVT